MPTYTAFLDRRSANQKGLLNCFLDRFLNISNKRKMIQSQYILDIFELAVDDHPFSELLRNQISLLTLRETDHTGIGAFIYFTADNEIERFRLDTSNSKSFDIEGNPVEMLSGVEIKNPDLLILAEATVHLKKGLIDHLEIWNKCGEDYVKTQPEHYELEQLWLDSIRKRKIIR
jgi:hypothetical protein